MRYFTDTIPPTLAEKLKEKGMPITYHPLFTPEIEGADQSVGLIRPMYCEVFDWLMSEKGIIIYVIKRKDGTDWHYQIGANIERYNVHYYDSWHEAANAAIEKALTLI